MTNDLERRIEEHNRGYSQSTKAYLPFELVYYEVYSSRLEARKREKYLKSSAGRRYLKRKLDRDSVD